MIDPTLATAIAAITGSVLTAITLIYQHRKKTQVDVQTYISSNFKELIEQLKTQIKDQNKRIDQQDDDMRDMRGQINLLEANQLTLVRFIRSKELDPPPLREWVGEAADDGPIAAQA